MDTAEIVALVAQYDTLLENYEIQQDIHSSRVLKEFLKAFPNIPNYDSVGNYVGPVANEDGWMQK
ncbi:hypothetical protein UFOVP1071_51 [uncultured Caudovirales phage]|uniref:Uncharacterized protein n=1 Tax=uncultured Caudovirales phage TaxID=2100421 RepID=A0A6J5QBZ3_9CAUD|nr:hypothetical protein UFOVP1071_51 [uncultured Caudovirales phage]